MKLPLKTEQDTNTGKWQTYSLFGLTLASDFSFANRLAPGNGTADLTFTCVKQASLPTDLEATQPIYMNPHQTADGKSNFYLYRQPRYDVLRFTGVADFYLWPNRIVCHLLDAAYAYMVEIALLGVVLAFWLEREGIPTLHASAAVVKGNTAAFLATNTGGKSSLAATLMQDGYPLLSDDMLAVEKRCGRFMGRPGYPQMRMWPDQAEHFLGHYQHLEQVHPAYSKRRIPVGVEGLGAFCDTLQPLGCFYLPERCDVSERGTGIEIMQVPPQDGLIALVRHSFTPNIVAAIGLQPQRLKFLAEVVSQIPIRRIVYPSGLEHLPRVRHAILEDLTNL